MSMNPFANLTTLLQNIVATGPAGCSCQVIQDGQILYENYVGQADLAAKRPIDAGTVFRVHSMSKVVTCLLALTYYERGDYLLDDPLAEYLPEFRHMEVYHESAEGDKQILPARNLIRIRDLLTMSSGLLYAQDPHPAGRRLDTMIDELYRLPQTGRKLTLRMLAQGLAQVPLAFEPGTRWHYGFSHDVIGALIEVLAGKPLGQVMQEKIFGPLAMKDTAFRLRPDTAGRLCTLYARSDEGQLTPETLELDAFIAPGATLEMGGAGLLSTLGDYGRFAHMLANGGELDGERIIGRKTIAMMARNHLGPQLLQDYTPGREGYGYGLGVRTMIDLSAAGSNGSVGEFGWGGLAGSWVMIDPSEGLSAVYMQQMSPSRLEIYEKKLRNAIYGAI
jgi:CubicO group peptidase (beta-lactamase class C family)